MTEDEILLADDPIKEAINDFQSKNQVDPNQLHVFTNLIRRIERGAKPIRYNFPVDLTLKQKLMLIFGKLPYVAVDMPNKKAPNKFLVEFR